MQDNSGYLCGREMPDLLRALGRNSFHTLTPHTLILQSINIVEWKFIVSHDFRNPTCDELNTIMAEVRLFMTYCEWYWCKRHLHVFQPNCVWLVLVWPLAANVKTAGGCWSQRKSWFERVRCDDVQSGRCHQQMILYFDLVSWCLQVIDRLGCGHWLLVRSIQVRSGQVMLWSGQWNQKSQERFWSSI